MGSWFGDWNLGDSSRNNLLRSFLGIQDYGLVALWGYREWPMTRFGLGRPIGASQTGSFDYRLDFEFAPTPFHAAPRRTTEILGDPTLRWTPPSSPCGLVGVRLGGDVTLTWRDGGDPRRAIPPPLLDLWRSRTVCLSDASNWNISSELRTCFSACHSALVSGSHRSINRYRQWVILERKSSNDLLSAGGQNRPVMGSSKPATG
jgi:hypothetical protein